MGNQLHGADVSVGKYSKHRSLSLRGVESERVGSYKVVGKINNSYLCPGDRLSIKYYIVGYGTVRFPKFSIYPSANIAVVGPDSYLKAVDLIGIDQLTGNWLVNQESQSLFNNSGVTILFRDETKNGVRASFFADMSPIGDGGRPSAITTESDLIVGSTVVGRPPIELSLKLEEKLRPGTYYIDSILTFFDGVCWQTEICRVDFEVMNWFKKYEIFSSTAGLIVLVSSVLTIIQIASGGTHPTSLLYILPFAVFLCIIFCFRKI